MPEERRPGTRERRGGKPGGSKAKAKGFLGKKIGPLPVWGWALGITGAILVGLYLRNRSQSGSTAGQTAANPAPADSGLGGGSSGGAGSGLTQPVPAGDTSIPPDWWLNPPDWWNQGGNQGGGTSGPSEGQPQPTDAGQPVLNLRTPASSSDFASEAQAKTLLAQALGRSAPYGGVTSVRRLASGATVTTYASGRQVEQVPGKGAYVTVAGSGAAPVHYPWSTHTPPSHAPTPHAAPPNVVHQQAPPPQVRNLPYPRIAAPATPGGGARRPPQVPMGEWRAR